MEWMFAKGSPPPAWLVTLFPFFFVGMWVFVGFIIAHIGGWTSFAAHFPALTKPAGKAYSVPYAQFGGWMRYNNVVRIIFTSEGIYFHAMFLFRAFQPPFMLPWSSVQNVEKVTGFFGDYLWMNIENEAGRIRLKLPAKTEGELAKYRKF